MVDQVRVDRRNAENRRAGLRMHHCSLGFSPKFEPNLEGRNEVWLLMAERLNWKELQHVIGMGEDQLAELLFGTEDEESTASLAVLYDKAEETLLFRGVVDKVYPKTGLAIQP